MLTDAEMTRRAERLRWLLLDVDGVFTDGVLFYSGRGEELKPFHVRDGLAVRLAQRGGLRVGVLSGRESAPLQRRARDLGMDAVMLGHSAKGPAFDAFLAEHGAEPAQVAYAGDDLLDLPVLGRVGLSFAPADAVPEVRDRVHRVLQRAGGRGAVRELVETLLRARGDWERVTEPWLGGGE